MFSKDYMAKPQISSREHSELALVKFWFVEFDEASKTIKDVA